ncbi:hypothetical protein MTO96_041803 [Rhipicephalus appendiculatus]|uniref:Lipocalin n=1 Tax=Rhipicephalus appendiculatus TaxID=34631 RepID=A0A131YTB6_RHIAP
MKHDIAGVRAVPVILIMVATSLHHKVNAENTVAQQENTETRAILRIVEVFNTTQRLWLYWKNYTIDTKIPDDLQNHGVANLDLTENCTYIKKINITEAYFHYWWHTMMLGELVRSHYYGAFFSEGGPEKRGSMNVTDLSESEPEPFQTMKLMHMGKDCSVFYVTPLEEDSNAGCELYVRNKVVSQGAPQDCLTYYEDNCKNKTVVYRSGCKSEVRQAQRQLKNILSKPLKKQMK